MIAASGKWLGSSEVGRSGSGAMAQGAAAMPGLGAATTSGGHGSFADAMQRSTGDSAVGSVKNTAVNSAMDSAMDSAMESTRDWNKNELVGGGRFSKQEAPNAAIAEVSKPTGAAAPNLRSATKPFEPVKTSAKAMRTNVPAEDVRPDVSTKTEEDVASAEASPKGSASLVAAVPAEDSEMVGQDAAKTRIASTAFLSTEKNGTNLPPGAEAAETAETAKDAEAAKTAASGMGKSRLRGEAKTKESSGKSVSLAVSGVVPATSGVGMVSAGSASAVLGQSVTKTVSTVQVSVSGSVAGKEHSMHAVDAADSKDTKDSKGTNDTKSLMGAAGSTTSAGGEVAGSSAVDAKSMAEKSCAAGTDASTGNGTATLNAMTPVAVMASVHPLNVSQGGSMTSSSHVSAEGNAAGSLQAGASGELRMTSLEAAKPNQLEVGLRGGEYGWLKVRAEIGANGEVNTFLRGATSTTTEALQAQAPKIAAYLGANDVAVRTVHVETATQSGGGAGAGFASGAGPGGGTQQESFRDGQKSLWRSATNGDEIAERDGGNEDFVPMALMSGRSVVSLTGTGNWLSVRA